MIIFFAISQNNNNVVSILL